MNASPLRRCLGLLVALACAAWVPVSVALAGDLRVTHLTCDHDVDPLGVDVARPPLAWRLESDARGQRQTAWQVLVSSTLGTLAQDRGDLWDSGRVTGDQSTHVPYAGAPLASSQQVFWKVRAWDRDGDASAWSEPATWTMGVLAPADWQARWIVAPWTSEALLLRKEFTARPGLRRALLHVSGLGHYEASLNATKAGDDLLSPGWTSYDRTVLYDTRDVTALVVPGANALGLTLGNGMYHVVRRDRFAKFTGSFGPLRAIAQLELAYADGTREIIGTDGTWRVHRGAITYNSIYGGEDYDARLLPAGWDRPGFDDSGWTRAVLLVRPAGTLRGHSFGTTPLRAIETRPPVEVRRLASGAVLYDFGQNASFMPRLRVRGPAGATVRLTPGEVVNADGTIDRGTMGGAHRGSAWWQYTKATDAEETWFPQFYYVGSRYLHVELQPAQAGAALPRVESLEMVVVHADAEPVGHFAASDPQLGRIRELVRWAQRSNFVSVLTDCPHREKLGWIEQYHLNGPSLRYEFDATRVFAKGARDMAEAQIEDGLVPNIAPEFTEFKGAFRAAAEWGAAFILVPWQHYLFTGDPGLLAEHYDAMTRYFAWLESRVGGDGLLSEGLGDWYDLLDGKTRAGLTPAPVTATAFLFHDADMLARVATVLGREEDARRFAARAEELRSHYDATFFHAAEASYATGSQAALALPLVMGIVAPGQRERVLATLVREVETRGYATAGDVGFRFLLRALADGGRSDVVHRLITQGEHPGYVWQLKHGATALTEAWDARRSASHNHFMLGQVTEWLYADLAGLAPDPAAPGFKHVLVRPQPVGDLTWVEASHVSPHGPVSVRWERDGTRFTLQIAIPANTTATVWMPAAVDASVTESGRPAGQSAGVQWLRREGDHVLCHIESGHYVFESQLAL